jgi:hypothetical protein
MEGREVAKLVARQLPYSSLGSNPDISQKYKMGGISKVVANKLLFAQKIYKKKRKLEMD